MPKKKRNPAKFDTAYQRRKQHQRALYLREQRRRDIIRETNRARRLEALRPRLRPPPPPPPPLLPTPDSDTTTRPTTTTTPTTGSRRPTVSASASSSSERPMSDDREYSSKKMATATRDNTKNDDLEMVCVDDELTLYQLSNFSKSSTAITAIETQLQQLVEKITKPQESVMLSVMNNNGIQELFSTFVKQGGQVQSVPVVGKPQVIPRIQSVTSLAPKVIQQPPVIQQNNITYRMVVPTVLNQNAANIPVQTNYRYITVPSQSVVRPPITIQSNPPLAKPPKTSNPISITYQNIHVPVVGLNKQLPKAPIVVTSRVTAPNPAAPLPAALAASPQAAVSFAAALASPLPADVEPTDIANAKDNTGNVIELTYYGSKQGNLSFGQSRGNFTFKCGQCQQILASNIIYMKHIIDHFQEQRLKNNLVSNLDCEYCFKAFPVVKDLVGHKHKVHNNSVFKCKVCEYSFPDKEALLGHLGKKHKPLQMPYVCKLCGYMTSVYQDILQHFAKRHDRTKFILCHLCLKVMADVRNFFKHCQMHYQSTNLSKGHCRMCKLIFLNSQDFRDHTAKEHIIHNMLEKTRTNKRQLPQIPTQSSTVPLSKKLKAIQASSPPVQPAALSFAKCIPEFQGPLRCCECGARANIQNHFRKHALRCSKCRYRTYCQRSYNSHSNIFHNSQRTAPVLHPVSKMYHRLKTTVTLTCNRCLFTTQSASFMAWHVVICPKGSSIVESFCYRKNIVSEPKKLVVNSEDPIVIDDSDDEDANTPTTSKNVAVNGVH